MGMNEIILLVGGKKILYKELSEKVEVLFPAADFIWLQFYAEIEEYFGNGGVAKLIFFGEEPEDYKGSSFLIDLTDLSGNIPIIFG